MKVLIAKSESELLENFARTLQSTLDEANSKSVVTVGLSGGSLIGMFSLVFDKVSVDWSKVIFVFCDERKVYFDDAESNFGQYKHQFLKKNASKIHEKQFIVIDPHLTVEKCAEEYERQLRNLGVEMNAEGTFPMFDVLILGVGPDGHTCSLFPNHDLLNEKTRWVASIRDSPKPPAERVTLTVPVLNNAKSVIFVATGASKAKVLTEIIEANQARPLPAGRVHPKSGKLFWLLDSASAAELKNKY